MLTIIEFIIIAGVLFLIGYPLFQKRDDEFSLDSNRDEKEADLINKKEYLYLSISELEEDYSSGKISDDDYNYLKRRYESEAISILKKLDGNISEDTMDVTIDEKENYGNISGDTMDVTSESAMDPTIDEKKIYCRQCGNEINKTDNFCFICGTKI